MEYSLMCRSSRGRDLAYWIPEIKVGEQVEVTPSTMRPREIQSKNDLPLSELGQATADGETDARMRTRPCPNCYLCGAGGKELYKDLEDRLFGVPGKWNFRRCTDSDCGAIWLDPLPLEEDIYKAYLSYFTHGDTEQAPDAKSAPLESHPATARRFKRLRHYLKAAYFASAQGYVEQTNKVQRLIGHGIRLHPLWSRNLKRASNYVPYVSGGRLLDVGCGDGIYLDYMRKLGWRVEGVEVDPCATERARSRGLLIYSGTLEDQAFKTDQFDVITLNHVLEHVHNPLRLLQECYRVLRHNGIIRIFVPNPASLGHRVFRSEWMGLDPPRHLHLWSPDGLKRIAIQAGFGATIETSSTPAKFNYLYSHHSFRVAATQVSSSLPINLQGFFFERMKSRFFEFYESIGIALGKQMWGEELVLRGRKVNAPPVR